MSWKTKSTKEVYTNKWMRVTEDIVITDHGAQLLYGVIHKKEAVLIIPWDGEALTLVEQFRYPIGLTTWEFPQGHLEHDSTLDTAKSELLEETGLVANTFTQIGQFYIAPGHNTQKCIVYLAEGLSQRKSQPEESEQGISTIHSTLPSFDEMICTGKMADGPSLAAYSIFKEYLTRRKS